MTPRTAPTSRTFVLVHGAWHDGRVWRRVVPLLEARGHRVLTPSLTGHGDRAHLLGPDVGLSTHVEDVLTTIADHDLTDVVLVGHSYAGMVVSAVAHRIPDRISHLVFVDAMVPTHGESALDVMPVTRLMIDAAADPAHPWRIPPLPEMPAPRGLFGVTAPEDLAWLRPTLGDESVRCFLEPVVMDDPAADAIPRTHILCVGAGPAADHPAAEPVVRRPVPARGPDGTPSRIRELPTGHDCMITEPAALTELLLEAGSP
ncbi:alpha/beta fold hydrolase [Pseudonocardia oroxyli]|uniref:Alpha/beta hydrolase family protein n=1 Tax=Pseudonocardia oroxyli TaxID=366584 RepID=A0A1G7E3D1_PSEOR|nr:alpha/beta hydrolase [Pseudonocardia oroxyli]SDE58171.1 Alpha/beta hydrolase family protein [Pseudonocardia oroxyli]